jgi:hypothetical protein
LGWTDRRPRIRRGARSMRIKLSLEKKILVAFVAGGALLLCAAWFVVSNGRAYLAAEEQADRLRDAERALLAVELSLRGAESGQRGYLLTGREDYLGPYERALDDIGRQMDEARTLLAERPEALALFWNVDALVRRKAGGALPRDRAAPGGRIRCGPARREYRYRHGGDARDPRRDARDPEAAASAGECRARAFRAALVVYAGRRAAGRHRRRRAGGCRVSRHRMGSAGTPAAGGARAGTSQPRPADPAAQPALLRAMAGLQCGAGAARRGAAGVALPRPRRF